MPNKLRPVRIINKKGKKFINLDKKYNLEKIANEKLIELNKNPMFMTNKTKAKVRKEKLRNMFKGQFGKRYGARKPYEIQKEVTASLLLNQQLSELRNKIGNYEKEKDERYPILQKMLTDPNYKPTSEQDKAIYDALNTTLNNRIKKIADKKVEENKEDIVREFDNNLNKGNKENLNKTIADLYGNEIIEEKNEDEDDNMFSVPKEQPPKVEIPKLTRNSSNKSTEEILKDMDEAVKNSQKEVPVDNTLDLSRIQPKKKPGQPKKDLTVSEINKDNYKDLKFSISTLTEFARINQITGVAGKTREVINNKIGEYFKEQENKKVAEGYDDFEIPKQLLGVNIDDVNDVMSSIPNFYGAIQEDEIDKIIERVRKEKPLVFSFIVLVQNYMNGGTNHFVSYWGDLKFNKEFCYYDSYANDPDNSVLKKFKNLFDNDLELPYLIKLKYNKIANQSLGSDVCALHAMYYIFMRMFGFNHKESTLFDDTEENDKRLLKSKYFFSFI